MATVKKKSAMVKTRLGMAGEYAVASELLRRGKDVSLTLGNAKAVDVFVYNLNSDFQTIEVKTSKSKRFVTNFFQKYPTPSTPHPDFWVIVYIDNNNVSNFFVLTHQEMADVQMQRNNMTSWAHVNGVDNVTLKDILPYKDQWSKIP